MLASPPVTAFRSDLARPTRKPVDAPEATPIEVLRLLVDGARAGRRGVLATITGLTGPGARAVGTHMAVLENGDSAGSFSSGCVEKAIVAEGLDTLRAGMPRTVRFGQGSSYIDIRLPCGGGMDVLFLPEPNPGIIERALASLDVRQPAAFHLDCAGHFDVSPDVRAKATGWKDGIFTVHHAPNLRLVLLGHGAEMLTSLRLARSFGAEVELYSPDGQIVETGRAEGVTSFRLKSVTSPVALRGDPWTAFLFLFHDHEWEPPLIRQALETPSVWVGAMGSRSTHAARCAALDALGVPGDAIARVRGPVGLIPASRDPATLALSALSEIVGAYRASLP